MGPKALQPDLCFNPRLVYTLAVGSPPTRWFSRDGVFKCSLFESSLVALLPVLLPRSMLLRFAATAAFEATATFSSLFEVAAKVDEGSDSWRKISLHNGFRHFFQHFTITDNSMEL